MKLSSERGLLEDMFALEPTLLLLLLLLLLVDVVVGVVVV